jgi:2-polyprenyl-6-hydroxyphenyl methylase/3-demethylubiquinone-9 3-methyltransferase
MTDASVTTDTILPETSATAAAPHASIVAREAAHFGNLAQDWWDPRGSSTG